MVNNEKAIDLINALIKAKKNLHLYPANHTMYEKTVDQFCLLMTSNLEVDSIKIRINQYDILYNDEVIYHSRHRDESLALFFFKDGLRELTFLKGIERDEIKEFLEIISLDFEKEVLDDDIVTLLWESDFQNIQYVVDDTFLMENDNYEEIATEQAKSAAVRDRKVMKAYENVIAEENLPGADILPLSDDDIQSIVQEIEDDPPDKTHILIQMLFEMFYIAQAKEEYEDITLCIQQTIDHAITGAHMKIVNFTLENTGNSLKRSAYPEEAGAFLNNIENYINSAVFIKRVGKIIDNGAGIPGELIQEFASYLHGSSIPHFISILGEVKNSSARRTVLNILAQVGAKDTALLAKGLRDKRWYVIRNILYVLRQIGDESPVEYIVRVADHSDKRVRKEAVYALAELGREKVLHILKERMSDEAETVRIAAYKAVGGIKVPQSKNMLTMHVAGKGFRDKDFAEKKELFAALSRWDEKDVVDFFIKIINKRALFRRTKNNETRAAAIHGLGLIGDDTVRTIAERFEKSRNRLLRAQAQEILRKY